ncbi:MAG: GNAT family N-acetyltransferase [Bacteroidia bacterium]|nr:GNAT family N-acetyltransferase [Bacteroidia bacterium]
MAPLLLQRLSPADLPAFKALLALFEEVFEPEPGPRPGDAHLSRLLARPDFIVLAALRGGIVLGGLTAYLLESPTHPRPMTYLYDLAVAAAHQRQGIARQLIGSLLEHSRALGAYEVFVQADEEDAHALAFYRSTGAAEAQVRQYSYPLDS